MLATLYTLEVRFECPVVFAPSTQAAACQIERWAFYVLFRPRDGVSAIGFSTEVVGRAMAKGTKTNAKPMQNRFSSESFLIDTGIGEASILGVAQDL